MKNAIFVVLFSACGVTVARDFSIVDFGGVGDGKTDCTTAFAKAVDAAHDAGGGRVTVPAGTWFTGPIQFRSNVELHVDDAATVRFNGDPMAYRPLVRSSFSGIECYSLSPLVHAQGCTNVAVTGGGLFTPVMDTWRIWFDRETPEMLAAMGQLYAWGEGDEPVENRRAADLPGARFRPCFFEFENCRNVRLEGFRIRQSPLWTVTSASARTSSCAAWTSSASATTTTASTSARPHYQMPEEDAASPAVAYSDLVTGVLKNYVWDDLK